MKFMHFSIKYRFSDILLKKHKLHLNRLFCCNHTCYGINMVPVTSASRYITSAPYYHLRYPSRSSMYIRGLISRNWPRQFGLLLQLHILFIVSFFLIHYRSLANFVYCSSICFQCSSPDQVYLRYLICTLTALELSR